VDEDEPDIVYVRGVPRKRVPFGEEAHRDESPCAGCGAYYFALHALGCEMEECPACGGALARCGCA
jgi:hypothetical protein